MSFLLTGGGLLMILSAPAGDNKRIAIGSAVLGAGLGLAIKEK